MLWIEYNPEADVLTIYLREGTPDESDEVAPGVIMDFDEAGVPLAIEILDARRVLSPEKPRALELPFQVSVG